LYEKYERLLIERNLTSYKVSQDTGIAQSSLSDWKRGISNPKVDKLKILAKYFDIPVDYFLDE
jgi:repressor LexA